MNRLITQWLAILALNLAVGNAYAAHATATASLDWSNFTWTGTPTITWIDRSSAVYATSTYVPDDSDFVNDWTTSITATAGTVGSGPAWSEANANSTTLSASAFDSDPSSTIFPPYANSQRGGQFTVSGDGQLEFSIPYALSATLTAPGEDAYAGVFLSVFKFPEFFVGQASDKIELDSAATSTTSGTLTLTFDVNDGDIYFLNASVESRADAVVPNAVVPVPAAVWLFTSALVGFLALGRRGVHA